MAINLQDKLVDNNLTREELQNRVVVKRTTPEDFQQICEVLAKGFGLSGIHEANYQLNHSKALLSESVKLVDAYTNKIYGLLIFTEYPIHVGSPLMNHHRELGTFLAQYKQVNGHAFIIDERLRGLDFDKEMIYYNLDFLKKNYDFIWCAVEKDLKSHNYWKRHGFMLFFTIPDASFYIMPLKESWIADIYKYRSNHAKLEDEKDNC